MDTTAEYKMTKLGKIPNDWDIKPLSQLASDNKPHTFIDGDWIESKDMAEEGIRIIQTGNIGIGKFIEKKSKRYISQQTFEELNCKEIYQGDILICRLADPIGRACLVPDKKDRLITSVDVTIFRPSEEYDSKYLVYYINSDENLSEINKYTSGTTRQRISRGNLANVAIKIPPLEEQRKIATIISTVDEQIEQTDQLIEKTTELKKGLMQQLLTKGIGHTEFKQSKLGEIPVEWDIALFEDIMLSKGEGIRRGPFGGALKKEIFVEEGFAIYEQQHAIHKDINKFRYFITPEKYDEMAAFNVKAGDILMSCSGTIGRVLLVPEDAPEGIINQALLRLRPKSYINLQFLKYLLQSEFVQNNILDRAHGSALKNMVAVSELKKIKLRIPQEEEQKKIAEILYSVDEEIEGYQEEKAKYEELKKGLMQQLLTGKKRVKV